MVASLGRKPAPADLHFVESRVSQEAKRTPWYEVLALEWQNAMQRIS